MKRYSKAIFAVLAALAVLTALIGIALLGAKTYVESAGTRGRVEAQLGNALGLPIAISELHFSPFSGLTIGGVSIPGEGGNFLEGATIRASCRFGPLLRRRLEIYGVRAENPKIVWRQNSDGKWSLPARAKPESEPKTEAAPKEKKSEGFQIVIDGFKVVNATIHLVDKDGQVDLKLDGFNLDYGVLMPECSEGTLRIDKLSWGALAVTGLHAPFKFAGGTASLAPIEATLAGGALKGSIEFEPNVRNAPFKAELKLAGADLGKIMTETAWAPDQFAGRIDGSVEAHGMARRISKLEGTGAISLAAAEIKGFELFSTIAEGLHIPELADLHLGDSSIAFHLGEEKVFIDSLALNSAAVKVLANGPVRLNGKMALDARLALAPATIQELPDFVRELVATANGEAGIDFKIGGSLSKPKTDLLDHVVGKRTLGQAADLVGNLFGDKKKKDDSKKKKDKDEAAKVTPPPLPAVDPTATTIVPPADPPPAPPQP